MTLLQFKLQDLNTFLTLYTKKKKVKAKIKSKIKPKIKAMVKKTKITVKKIVKKEESHCRNHLYCQQQLILNSPLSLRFISQIK